MRKGTSRVETLPIGRICTACIRLWSQQNLLIVTAAVFFFQAEDGIRDDLVTGVQTCALPICTVPVGDLNTIISLEPYLLANRERFRSCDDSADGKTPEELFADQVDEREERARVDVQEERRHRLHPPPQAVKVSLHRRMRRDDPEGLKTDVAAQSVVDVATVGNPEVMRGISNLRPDVEQIGALFLAAGEGVRGEPEWLTRRPVGPDGMRQQWRVETAVLAQVPAVVVFLRHGIAVAANQPAEPQRLVHADLIG